MAGLGRLEPAYGTGRSASAAHGYVRIWAPTHPLAQKSGYVYEHRKVVYDAGITVLPGQVVHHDRTDNRLENLIVTTPSAHLDAHRAENPEAYRIRSKRKRKYPRKPCAHCGFEFQPRVSTNLCCSVSCAQTRRYARLVGVR